MYVKDSTATKPLKTSSWYNVGLSLVTLPSLVKDKQQYLFSVAYMDIGCLDDPFICPKANQSNALLSHQLKERRLQTSVPAYQRRFLYAQKKLHWRAKEIELALIFFLFSRLTYSTCKVPRSFKWSRNICTTTLDTSSQTAALYPWLQTGSWNLRAQSLTKFNPIPEKDY